MNRKLAISTTLFLSSSVLSAAPTVNGNLISWPSDGWYQVQSETDYSSICEGGASCTVQPGSYLVVNHTTGERFPGIEVGASNAGNTPSDTSNTNNDVSVDGNTISWPDNGWYQVQDASSFVTECEGGRSCEVSAGSYIVINHSTGLRYPNIVVGATQSSTPENSDDSPSGTTTVISEANYSALLNQVLGVFAGQHYGLELMQLPAISERRYQQFPAIPATVALACNNRGIVDITGELPVFYQSIWNYNFQGCLDNDTQIQGPLYRRTDSQRVMWSPGFSQIQTSEAIRFDGGANFLFMNARGGSSQKVWSTNNLNLELQNQEGTFTVSQASSYFETTLPYTAFLNGGFTYSSALTSGQTVSVTVTEDFVYSDLSPDADSTDWFFTVGTLSINTANGDSLILRARTENDETLEVEINNSQGQTILVEQWSAFTDSLIMPIDFEPDYAD